MPEQNETAPGLREQIVAAMREETDRQFIRCGEALDIPALTDAVLAVVQPVIDEARATNQRLNYRAQRAESENATYRRAVGQWDVSERGTYIPLSSLRTIGKAAGTDILGSPRHLAHYDRVEQAEAAIARVREVCDQLQRASVLADGQPHTDREHGVAQAVARVRTALTPPAPADQTEGEGT